MKPYKSTPKTKAILKKSQPQPIPVPKKTSLLEVGKNLAILCLACSAVYLASQVEAFTKFSAYFHQVETTGHSQSFTNPQAQEEAIYPHSLLAIRHTESGQEQIVVHYDENAMINAFALSTQILKEALSSLQTSQIQTITQADFQSALSTAPSLYLDWPGQIPLSILSQWMSESQTATTSAQLSRMLLTPSDGGMALLYQENNQFFSAPLPVLTEERLATVLTQLSGAPAQFAFQNPLYQDISPLSLFSLDLPQPHQYTATTPYQETSGMTKLLEDLGFQTTSQGKYNATDGVVVRSGSESLRLSPNGMLWYQGEGSRRYTLPFQGETISLSQQIEGCFHFTTNLLSSIQSPLQVSLYAVSEEENLKKISFSASLQGIQLSYDNAPELAEFWLDGDTIQSFVLYYRSYLPTEETSVLLPVLQAQAILTSMEQSQSKLQVMYQDSGSEQMTASWLS